MKAEAQVNGSVPDIGQQPLNTNRVSHAVARESLKLRCTQAVHAVVPMTSALLVVATLLWTESPHERLLAWILSCFAATVIAALDCRAMLPKIDTASPQHLVQLNRRFLATTLLNTTAMGAGVWWVAMATTADIGFFVTLCLCFYAIGHVINGSSNRPSFLAGLSANLLQAIAFWFLQGEHGFGIAIMLTGIFYLLCTFARQSARAFAENVSIRFENVDLVEALSEEKKTVERALTEAKEASLAKSRFLAAASHDLRQPLHALSLWTGLLGESLTTPLSLQRMQRVSLAMQSLNKLFSGLLDLSQFDGGSIVAEPRDLRLQEIFDILSNDAKSEAEAKGLELHIDETTSWVRSDPLWLERILRNLLDNAIKYTAHGSVALRCEDQGDSVRIVVRDTGIGISKENQTHVFEEYFQVHNPARNRAQGVGLGLAIVRRACNLLGHPLSLNSEPGEGSEFAIVLQKCERAALADAQAPVAANQASRLDGLVVVVVENDSDVASATEALLHEWGCVPIIRSSAKEAIDALAQRDLTPRGVIADYRLSKDASGAAAIESLRRSFGPLPAAVVTGEVNVVDLQARAAGAFLVLQKPLDPVRLRELLRSFQLAA